MLNALDINTVHIIKQTETRVNMGEIHFLQGGGMFRSPFGSCLGIIGYDANKKICVMAHAVEPHMYPYAPKTHLRKKPGYYVPEAVANILKQLHVLGAKTPVFYIVGGHVTPFSVGRKNCETILHEITNNKLNVVYMDIGIAQKKARFNKIFFTDIGNFQKSVTFNVATGKIDVVNFTQPLIKKSIH